MSKKHNFYFSSPRLALSTADMEDDEWVDVKGTASVQTLQQTDTTSFHAAVQESAHSLLSKYPNSPIFRADLKDAPVSISEVYEHGFPVALQQEFNCKTCRQFLDQYGDLALVDPESGSLLPLFWNFSPSEESFKGPISAMKNLFQDRKVCEEFKVTPENARAGKEESGGFKHLNFEFPWERLRKEDPVGFSAPAASELASMLEQVLKDYQLATVQRASQLLLENELPYADSHKASISWLLDLKVKDKLGSMESTCRHNLKYHLATSSFIGCLKKLRSGALSTLLSNIEHGVSLKSIRRQWDLVACPDNYMRPKSAPSAGNIAAAERLFAQLGLEEKDLRRRYLVVDEIPKQAYMFRDEGFDGASSKPSLFGQVVPKNPPNNKHGKGTLSDLEPISFSTFVKVAMSGSRKIEYKLASKASLFFFVTGLEDSKPLMQWHDDTNRVSWYTRNPPAAVREYGLSSTWTKVPYIIPFPHLWDGIPLTTTFPLLPENHADYKFYHQKEGFEYLIGLEGIKEPKPGSLCLFPELLKNEFHGVRSTIEAYSEMGKIEVPLRGAMVGGIQIGRSDSFSTAAYMKQHLFRVMDLHGKWRVYEIVEF